MLAPIFEAVEEFFGRVIHAGQQVPVVFSSPDRAHSEMNRIIARRTQGGAGEGGNPEPRQGQAATLVQTSAQAQPTLGMKSAAKKATSTLGVQETERRPAPTPFMSLWMPPPKFAPERFSPATIRGFDKDIKSGTAKSVRYPRPVNFEVQVDLWCGSAGGHTIAQNIEGQIELQFVAESAYLPVDWTDSRWYRSPFFLLEHARTLGRTRVRLVAEGWADNSEAEGEGSKEVRRTWTGRLEAQIPYKPEEVRLVRSVNVELYDNTKPDSPVLLDETTGGVED